MRILFVIKNIHSAKGGAEKILCDLATYLENGKQNSVEIVSFDGPTPIPFYKVSESVKITGLQENIASKRTTPLDFLKRIIVLRRKIKENKPDVVVSFMHSSMVITALSCLGLKTPFIGSEHIVKDHYNGKPIEYLLLMISIAISKKTTVISESIRNSFPLFKDRLVVISNPVEQSPYVIWPDRIDSKVLISVGRLEFQKNHETLIRAMKLVTSRYPDWRLRIYGEGKEFDNLTKLIGELELANQVRLMGIKTNIFQELLEADIFIFPSRYESFGLALAEALSSGLPAIGFKDVEGVDGLIKNQFNGFLLDGDFEDDEELSEKIMTLIADKKMRRIFSINASGSVVQNRPEDIFSRWESLLTQVVRN